MYITIIKLNFFKSLQKNKLNKNLRVLYSLQLIIEVVTLHIVSEVIYALINLVW